jgi:hypothetical protein
LPQCNRQRADKLKPGSDRDQGAGQPARVCQDRFDVYAELKFHQSSIPSQRLQNCADKPGIPDTIRVTVPKTFSRCPVRTLVSRAPCNSELDI